MHYLRSVPKMNQTNYPLLRVIGGPVDISLRSPQDQTKLYHHEVMNNDMLLQDIIGQPLSQSGSGRSTRDNYPAVTQMTDHPIDPQQVRSKPKVRGSSFNIGDLLLKRVVSPGNSSCSPQGNRTQKMSTRPFRAQ